jgi:hypothetical protein
VLIALVTKLFRQLKITERSDRLKQEALEKGVSRSVFFN